MPTRTSQKKTINNHSDGNGIAANDAVANDAAANDAAANDAAVIAATGKSAARDSKAGESKNGKAVMGPKDIEHFQELLLVERVRLEDERDQIRSRSGSVDGALPEEGEGGDEDTADLASAMMDKEMDLSVEDEIEQLLGAVDHALQKIKDGTYGVCDMSGEMIPKARLELIPWAALTVECQAMSEGQ